MSEELKIIQNEDGTFSEYDDTFDITIHCHSEEEQNEVLAKLNTPQSCGDCISREAVMHILDEIGGDFDSPREAVVPIDYIADMVSELPPVTPQPKMGRCKDCKYFEYDSVAEVHGIPLIVAHEICKKWGDGCQSKEDGYCFLFEPKTQEVGE